MSFWVEVVLSLKFQRNVIGASPLVEVPLKVTVRGAAPEVGDAPADAVGWLSDSFTLNNLERVFPSPVAVMLTSKVPGVSSELTLKLESNTGLPELWLNEHVASVGQFVYDKVTFFDAPLSSFTVTIVAAFPDETVSLPELNEIEKSKPGSTFTTR